MVARPVRIRSVCVALVVVAFTSCGSGDEEALETLEARVEAAEERIAELEQTAAVANPQTPASRTTGSPTAPDPLLDAAADRIDEVAESSGSSDIQRLVEAAFEDVPEFGSDDPEFGGVLVSSEGDVVEVVLRRNGLLYLDSLALAMVSLGFDEPSIRVLSESRDGSSTTAESVDGFTQAEATGTDEELRVLLSPT
jgi:hypothetical protein